MASESVPSQEHQLFEAHEFHEWALAQRAAAVAALVGLLHISLYTRNVCFLYQYSTNNHLPSLHFYTAYR